MMRRYLTYPLLFDLGICFLLIISSIVFKDQLKGIFQAPTMQGLDKLTNGLITVGATLMGFLLTIITVIVTFKKGFEDDKRKITPKSDNVGDSNPLEGIKETVFESTVSKEYQFYNSDLHKRVGIIFTNATYECGVVLLVLLLLQFEVFRIQIFYATLSIALSFICLTLAIVRSLFIFKYFLRIHLHDTDGSSSKSK